MVGSLVWLVGGEVVSITSFATQFGFEPCRRLNFTSWMVKSYIVGERWLGFVINVTLSPTECPFVLFENGTRLDSDRWMVDENRYIWGKSHCSKNW